MTIIIRMSNYNCLCTIGVDCTVIKGSYMEDRCVVCNVLRSMTFSPPVTQACIREIDPCFVGPNDASVDRLVK